jgi:membrane-bound serine protease (ClpP class)
VIGLVSLLLGAYGLQMLPVNYAGLALIVVGVAMMIAEVFTPTMGALGFAGVVAFVVGSLILIDTQSPGYNIPLSLIAGFAVTSAGLMIFLLGAAVKARHGRVRTGIEGMIGGAGEALQDFSELGRVRAFGEIWQARSEAPIAEGDKVRVVDVDGLILIVKPED